MTQTIEVRPMRVMPPAEEMLLALVLRRQRFIEPRERRRKARSIPRCGV
jgi:hypothetical protein